MAGHGTNASNAELRYLSIITLPEGWGRDEAAQRLADHAGLDRYSTRMKLGQRPPMILGRFDPATASRATATLIAHGGDAFAPSMSDIAALGPTLKIRDLRITPSGLRFELWRGEAVTIDPNDVEIVIRGSLSESTIERGALSPVDLLNASSTNPRTASIAVGWGLGGAYGLAAGLYNAWQAGEFSPERTATTSHKLDVHVADERVFQIDGDKFGYGILGDLRAHSDNTNIDRMCELLVHLNPRAVVDAYFRLFRPPAGHDRMRLPMMNINRDDPAFAFYSRWSALLYRHVMRG
jgi:hypothetical protein